MTQTLAQVGREASPERKRRELFMAGLVKLFKSQTDNGRLNSKKSRFRKGVVTKNF